MHHLDELENFRQNIGCNYNTECSCETSKISIKRKIEDRAMQFLRGLKDSDNNVRSHVLLLDPLPSL